MKGKITTFTKKCQHSFWFLVITVDKSEVELTAIVTLLQYHNLRDQSEYSSDRGNGKCREYCMITLYNILMFC